MSGWLGLIGGGEFSFGETLEADRAWLEKTPEGPVGFIPAGSGSVDYGLHFAGYLRDAFGREVETIPIFRVRDGRRLRNAERIAASAAIYLGGGIADQFADALRDTPAAEALAAKIASGGVVAAIGAAAQACGAVFRDLRGSIEYGLGLVPATAVEANFDPGHDRRLRALLGAPGVERGIGISAGSLLLVDSEGRFEALGDTFTLAAADADVVPLVGGAIPE